MVKKAQESKKEIKYKRRSKGETSKGRKKQKVAETEEVVVGEVSEVEKVVVNEYEEREDVVVGEVNETSDNELITITRKGVQYKRKKRSVQTVRPKKQIVICDDGETKAFETQCNPKRLFELIKDFNEKQRSDVIEIGFGGLLHIRLDCRLPPGLMPFLVSKFDGSFLIQTIGTEKYYVNERDVHDALGLPINTGNPVISKKRVEKNDSIRARWEKKYGVNSDGIPLSEIANTVKTSKDGGDDFKRCFVIFAVGVLLSPNVSCVAEVAVMKAVEDVKRIRHSDWSNFVVDRLSKSISRYHLKNKKTATRTCNGCLLVPLLCYLHRFPLRSLPRDLPLIKHWTKEKLYNRVKCENQKGGFGRLIMTQDAFPITPPDYVSFGDDTFETKKMDDNESADKERVEVESTQMGEEKDEEDTEDGFIKFPIPEGFLTMKKIRAMKLDPFNEALTVFKRNLDVVINAHKNAMVKSAPGLKKANESSKPISVENVDTNATNKENDDQEWEDMTYTQGFFNIIDEIVKNMRKQKEEFTELIKISDPPKFTLINSQEFSAEENVNAEHPRTTEEFLDEENVNADPPIATEVNLAENVNADPSIAAEANLAENVNADPPIATEENLAISPTWEEILKFEKSNQQIIPPSSSNQQIIPPSSHPGSIIDATKDKQQHMTGGKQNVDMNALLKDIQNRYELKEQKELNSYFIGCSLDCGDEDVEYTFVSKELIKHKNGLSGMPILVKQVADFLFSEYLVKTDDGDCLCYFGPPHSIVTEDISSMHQDVQITANLVNAYAVLLNVLEFEKEKLSRFIFGCSQSGIVTKLAKRHSKNAVTELITCLEDWCANSVNRESIDLTETTKFFVPHHVGDSKNGHFTLYVVNIDDKKIQYMDNLGLVPCKGKKRIHGSEKIAKVLGEVFVHFLKRMEHPNAEEVSTYKYEYINCPWACIPQDPNQDCAVFVMSEMKTFDGANVKCQELNHVYTRFVLRVYIIASLMLSDKNQFRNKLMAKVDDFLKNKEKAQTVEHEPIKK